MILENLYQDPESPAPYAEAMVIDAGGIDLKYGGEFLAHVSFDEVDPFEIAFHALPDDWAPHEETVEYDDREIAFLPLTPAQLAENAVNRALIALGKARGWERA